MAEKKEKDEVVVEPGDSTGIIRDPSNVTAEARTDDDPDFTVPDAAPTPSPNTVDGFGNPVDTPSDLAPQGVDDQPGQTEDFESMTKDELFALLEEKGVNVSSRATKDELVALAKEDA